MQLFIWVVMSYKLIIIINEHVGFENNKVRKLNRVIQFSPPFIYFHIIFRHYLRICMNFLCDKEKVFHFLSEVYFSGFYFLSYGEGWEVVILYSI